MRAAIAAAAVVSSLAAGVAGLGALGSRVQQPAPISGDQVGMEPGEAWSEYRERSAATLDRAPGDEEAYALVTFQAATSLAAASAALEPARRVGAVVFPGTAPRPIPEPVGRASREDVFRTEAQRAGRAADAVGVELDTGLDMGEVAAAVVYDTGDTLREVSARPAVAAVEVLPPDAVWGAFAVRPSAP